MARGHGAIEAEGGFRATEVGPFRLGLEVSGTAAPYGSSSIGMVGTERRPFTFFLPDVRSEYPALTRACGVVVTTASDHRSYAEIDAAACGRGLRTKLETIESEPEESFAAAAAHTRRLSRQTWLGLARDIRIFAVGERLDWVRPRFHGDEVALPETANKANRYQFLIGRRWGAVDHIPSRQEAGANGAAFDPEAQLNEITAAWPTSRLVQVWNSFAGAPPFADLKEVKKFTDHKTATARIWTAALPLGKVLD